MAPAGICGPDIARVDQFKAPIAQARPGGAITGLRGYQDFSGAHRLGALGELPEG
jgi:hypothetical protein